MAYKILVTEMFEIPDVYLESGHLESGQIHVMKDLWQNPQQLIETAKDYDALIVRNMTQVDQALLSQLTTIKVIGRLGAGTENVDLGFAEQCNIPVVYAPCHNTNAVAEFCVGQVFNALRSIPDALNETKQGGWNRGKYLTLGKEISSSTIGVVGFGAIGQSFALKMRALGANVLVYNRTPEKVTTPFHYSELTSLLAQSDVISIHLPGGNKTRHFLDEEALESIKPGAFLINTARGSVIDEKALLAALESKQLAGAMLDVRSIEPASLDALSAHPNVYPTPHIAALTSQAQTATSVSVISDILKVLTQQQPDYPATTV